jgi:hypothetical protein
MSLFGDIYRSGKTTYGGPNTVKVGVPQSMNFG